MAAIHDLLELTDISSGTTYSLENGNLLGVVDNMTSGELDDGEFDEGDVVNIGGVNYTIDLIEEPDSTGAILLGDGSSDSFGPGSESNLSFVFLTLSNGGDVRYFAIPNDSFGDMNVQALTTGAIQSVGGSDAAIISTTDNDIEVVCFTAGTLIETEDGQQTPVEHLQVGDRVLTLDCGLQKIRWIGAKRLPARLLRECPRLRPVQIAAGTLGPGCPQRDLLVSPQHSILVRSKIALRMFGAPEVLVAAKQLVALEGVAPVEEAGAVTYYHLLLDRHDILWANGAPCESLYTGPQALRTLSEADRAELSAILPEVIQPESDVPACRPMASGRRARQLAYRHRKNNMPLADEALLQPGQWRVREDAVQPRS
ncbi:hypothetical protein A8B82_12300 [Sulfitobacter sp. EhC04]|uniref:Hint domain-containing protein n=1 Tax=Sulfitobacter sp. EhC04 TaxID=1849168 RepID=UPI0007F51D3A|nr:Hint domain-containing protein [Sulfitobacter sp. EhC04]OAN77686.1 hypothetical protein A8B82_12300 [Sulfitobacter sp. EhC04]